MIAALFVATGGVYFGLPGVDPWDKARDARLYPGPWPVVAHPPCERWGRYAHRGLVRRAEVLGGREAGAALAAPAPARRTEVGADVRREEREAGHAAPRAVGRRTLRAMPRRRSRNGSGVAARSVLLRRSVGVRTARVRRRSSALWKPSSNRTRCGLGPWAVVDLVPRPAAKGHEGEVYHPLGYASPRWVPADEPCTFHGPTGCELEHDARPLGCRALVPGQGRCVTEEGLEPHGLPRAWRPYQALLRSVAWEVDPVGSPEMARDRAVDLRDLKYG